MGDVAMKAVRWLVGSVLVLVSVEIARAQNGAWGVDASGDWSDTANWVGGTLPGAGGTAYFTNTITGARTITLPSDPVNVAQLVFGTNDISSPLPRTWTFSGGAFTNLSWIEAAPWPVSNAHKVVFLSRFDGDDPGQSLTIIGSTSNAVGEIWLCVSNSYRGTTYVGRIARVVVSNAWAFGTPESPTIISNGAGVKLRGSITLEEPFQIMGIGNIPWSGAIDSQEGTNTLKGMITLGTGGARLGATVSGAALVVQGGVTGNVGLALQASSLIIITNNPILIYGNQLSCHSGGRTILAVSNNSVATVEIAHTNTLVLQVHNAVTNENLLLRLGASGTGFKGTLDMNGYNLTVGQIVHAAGIANAEVCAITSRWSAVLQVNQAVNTVVSNLWRGPIVLVKNMGGTLSLMGTNLLTGGILVAGGTLRVGHPGLAQSIRVPTTVPVTNQAFFEILAPGLVLSSNVFVGAGTNRHNGADGLLVLTQDSPDFTGTWQVLTGAVLATTSYALGAHNAGTLNVNYQGGPSGSRALWLSGNIGITGKTAYTSGGGFTNISSLIPGAGDWTNTYPLGPGAIRSLSGTNVWAGNVEMTAGAGSTYLAADAGAGLIVDGTVYASATDRILFLDGAGVGILRGVISNGATVNLPIQKQGTGTWTIAASNQAGGDLTISSGTVRIGEGGTQGELPGGSVNNQGTLVFDRSDTYVVPNFITGSGDLIQAGSGTTVLTGFNNYSGNTIVSNGTLLVQTTYIGGGLITVDGGTFGGNGMVNGPVTVNSGGKLAPGSSAGTFTVNANVTLDSGAMFEVELNGTTPGASYDQLVMGSTALVLNNPTLSVLLGFSPSLGDTFTIVTGFSSQTGTFNGLPDHSTFNVGGTQFQINYNSNDITLTVVPEPGTMAMLSLALAAGVVLRRRRS